MDRFDVVVIGAGPAGVSSALLLHKMGFATLVLDQAVFPRDKVCGEFISPAADPILDELGVLSAIEARSPVRLRGVVLSAYEKNEIRIPYPPIPGSPVPPSSLSVPRTTLDNLLLERARTAGIEARERHKVDDLIFADGSVAGVTGLDGQKKRFTLRARLVVDAGGRNSVSVRRLDLRRGPRGPGKVALAAHWRGVTLPQPFCYMHVSRPGYTGISQVGEGRANVVLVVDGALLKGRDLDAFYRRAVLGNRPRKALLDGGAPEERPRTVESLAFSVLPVPCGGLVLAGDAMGFIDPFTGEGVYLALRSAQLAAGVAGKALSNGGFTSAHSAEYETLRQREFGKKFLLSRILQRLIYNPFLCNYVTGALAKNPSLAATLAGVIGDYFPAERVVSMKFLLRLVAAATGFPNGGDKQEEACAALKNT
ncbi:MAG: NAD(P)/FAD-dependent oxidoreductase [Nitrospinae bacterium]|nr:NAD(P)/FAD-dependent oxidoreductase [Nitrospinota bacterium]